MLFSKNISFVESKLYNMKSYAKYIVLAVMVFLVASQDCYSQSSKRSRKEDVKVSESAQGAAKKKKSESKKTKKAESDETEPQIDAVGKRYLFGVAISYADSLTMVTDICEINGMKYNLKTGEPVGLDLYTRSFKDYILRQNKRGYLCSTFVSKSKKEAEDKMLAIRRRVAKKKITTLAFAGDFKYEYINTDSIYTNEYIVEPASDVDDDF